MKTILRMLIISITAVFIPAVLSLTVAAAPSPESDFEFKNGAITKYVGSGGAVEIPAEIGGVPVTSIESRAFDAMIADNTCQLITSLIIPEGVTSIKAGAFFNCNKLTVITIPESVESIELGAVLTCGALKKAYFNHSNAGDIELLDKNPPISVIFVNVSPDFVIICSETAAGFINGSDFKWNGYDIKRTTVAVPVLEQNWDSSEQTIYSLNASAELKVTLETPLDDPVKYADYEISYQWYENTANTNTGGTPITGATSSNYIPPTNASGEYYYYVEITNTNKYDNAADDGTTTATVTSEAAVVSVHAKPSFTLNLPAQDFSYADNDVENRELKVTATLTGGTLMYQWYENDQRSNIGGTPVQGATGDKYTPPVSITGPRYYYVIAYDANFSADDENSRALSNIVRIYIWDHTKLHIDYDIDDVIITGSVKNTPDPKYTINLTKETISLPSGYKAAAYSVDGGIKWKMIASKPFNNEMFAKLLTKNITLVLTNKYDKKAKQPADDSIIIEFAEIQKRPKLATYIVNYEIGADSTGATPGTWLLSEKNGETAIKEGIEVAVSDKSGKAPNKDGYGKFYMDKGIEIKSLPSTGKSVKSVFFIKNAAQNNGDGSYTAASKAKKISVLGEQKPPNYKLDKNNLIKYKTKTYIFKGDITEPTSNLTNVKFEDGKGAFDVEDYKGDIYFWTAATIKKPASAKQKLKVS